MNLLLSACCPVETDYHRLIFNERNWGKDCPQITQIYKDFFDWLSSMSLNKVDLKCKVIKGTITPTFKQKGCN